MVLKITSLQNDRVKDARRLQNRRARDESGLFLIEGYRELFRAAQSGVQIEELFFCRELFLGINEEELIEKCQGAAMMEVSESVFRKLSYRDRPDGLLAVARKMQCSLEDLDPESGFFLVAEAIEKPGNLGAMMRSADGAGAGGVIVCDRCTDIYNPNVVRASVGTLFTRPVVEAGGQEVLAWLKGNGFQIVAATPAANRDFTEVDLSGKVALVVGTEQLGLTEMWMEAADICVSIPMCGVADSLNVSVAATLLMYETLRQKSASRVL